MSEVNLIGSAQAKVIPLNEKTNEETIRQFFSFYLHRTNDHMLAFLDLLYNEYLKSQSWQFARISEKTIAEFNYQLLRKFLQNIKQ